MSSEEAFRPGRLRWGTWRAWKWTAFAAATAVDALILHILPPAGDEMDLLPALILAACGNVLLVGVAAPWIAGRLARREGDVAGPAVAGDAARRGGGRAADADRIFAAVLGAGAVGLLAAGLATRPFVVSETDATERNANAVREWVIERGTAENRRNLETANTIRVRDDYFRTCIASDDRRRPLCLFVDTDRDPPAVRRDPTAVPNAEFRRGTDYP